jgi:hypothetical protein
MARRKHLSFSPAIAISLVALFFALGGSAFALGEHVQSVAAVQKRCTNGAVRGIAAVTGDPSKGIANLPDQFSSSKVLFARKFNCTGRATQVRRVGVGVYEVRFVGQSVGAAVASAVGDATANVESVAAGTFRISVHPAGLHDTADLGFTIVSV